jgi:protein ImuB
MKRVLALYLPYLSTERRRRDDLSSVECRLSIEQPAASQSLIDTRQSPMPIVTIAPDGQTLRLVHLNAAAEALRLHHGQTLAEAKALVPELGTYNDDPLVDRQQLENLAVWAQCLSPTVHIEGEDTLFLDVTGCDRLFGGEANLLRSALEGIHARGFTGRGTIADTPGAAWALAHAGGEPEFASGPGCTAADLAPLPVWSLRVDEKIAEALRLVGVETVGSLLHLPRSSLASRFGEDVLNRIDQALGDLPEVLTPYMPQPVLSARLDWGTPIAQWDLLHEAVRRAVCNFCEDLSRRVAGVRQMMVTFYCPGVTSDNGTTTRPMTISVALSRPTRSAKHLLTLLKVQLEDLRLPAGADGLMVWALEIEALDDPQGELFATPTVDVRALGDLLDRLAVRLGTEAVVRPQHVSDHQPECAFRYESVVKRTADSSSRGSGIEPPRRLKPAAHNAVAPRPLRLSARPLPIVAMSVVPDGPPIAFRYRGKQHAIAEAIGPERIETGWWRGPHVRRDYYRVVTEDGLRCWLFRDRVREQWLLHGWFD